MAMKRRARRAFELPHADDVVGTLSLIGKAMSLPVESTIADLDIYRGIARDRLFPAPARTPRVSVARRWQMPGVVSEDLTFKSPHRPIDPAFRRRYENEYRENHTVYVRRIRPATAGARPRLIYLHGYMQPETLVEEMTLLAGMALYLDVELLQPQPPYHGRRSPRAARLGGELYWTADLVRSIEAMRQHVLDTRALLSWLLQGDPRPVGLMGLSLGGAVTAMLTCVESRFDFSIPIVAHMDLEAMVADAPVMSGTRRDLRRFGWRREDFAQLVADLGLPALRPLLPAKRIFIYAASDDRFFDPQVVEKMWRDWKRPQIRWYDSSHMGFLRYMPEVLANVRSVIDHSFAHRGSPGA
jgi:pimeloyl-ACP methyl ester carboxylesterase